MLRDHLADALAGQGSLMLVSGEAGIGKTTLTETLCREAAEQGAHVLVGRCYDLSETPPYGPWGELFGRYQPGNDLPPLPTVFARRGTVGEVGSQTALFNQIQDFVTEITQRQPLVLLLDDLHWADPASLDLLRFLARSLANMPFLLLATYRADELTRRHPLYALLPMLVREASAARIDLHHFEAIDIHTLVNTSYLLPDADVNRLVAYLHGRSEGNPFFLSELLHALEAERVLRRSSDGWALGDLSQARVPLLLRQVIDSRLARLDDDAQRLLAVAAVIGQEVPLALWSAVAEADGEAVLAVVERAHETHIVVELPDSARVRFAHALIREALYEGIVPTRRRAIHRRVGEVLATTGNPDPDEVAYHFRQAGDARACEWMVAAGARAQRAYAWIMAAERYETALALMGEEHTGGSERAWLLYHLARMRRYSDPKQGIVYMDEAIRCATRANDHAFLALLTYDRGLLRCFAGDLRNGLPEMESGATALESLSREDLKQLAIRNFEGSQARSDGYRGTVVLWLAEAGFHAKAREMGSRIVAQMPSPALVKAVGSSGYADAYNGLGFMHAALGNRDEARAAFIRGREYHHTAEAFTMLAAFSRIQLMYVTLPYDANDLLERQRLAEHGEQAYVQARGAWANLPSRVAYTPLLLLSGDWVEAEQQLQAWLIYGSAQAEAFRMLAALACHRGDDDQAWELILKALPDGLATVPGDVPYLETLMMQQIAGTLALHEGDVATARSWLEMHDRWLDWGEAVLGQSEGQALWAEYYRVAGDAKRVYDHARRALAHATEPRQPLALLAAHRLLGELDTNAGRVEDAAMHLDASLALADACAAPYERARTLLALAELAMRAGKRAEAMAFLDEARAICVPLDAKPALARADALVSRLTASKDATHAYPAGLSAREVEVLRLLAAGRTNREIADILFLSPNTVRIHVTHILEKTNTDNRAAAAAFAQRHGLT